MSAFDRALFFISVLLVAVPNGLEIINLSASIITAICILPSWDADHQKSTVTNFCNRWKVRYSSPGYRAN
jgi:hypothetical protein